MEEPEAVARQTTRQQPTKRASPRSMATLLGPIGPIDIKKGPPPPLPRPNGTPRVLPPPRPEVSDNGLCQPVSEPRDASGTPPRRQLPPLGVEARWQTANDIPDEICDQDLEAGADEEDLRNRSDTDLEDWDEHAQWLAETQEEHRRQEQEQVEQLGQEEKEKEEEWRQEQWVVPASAATLPPAPPPSSAASSAQEESLQDLHNQHDQALDLELATDRANEMRTTPTMERRRTTMERRWNLIKNVNKSPWLGSRHSIGHSPRERHVSNMSFERHENGMLGSVDREDDAQNARIKAEVLRQVTDYMFEFQGDVMQRVDERHNDGQTLVQNLLGLVL